MAKERATDLFKRPAEASNYDPLREGAEASRRPAPGAPAEPEGGELEGFTVRLPAARKAELERFLWETTGERNSALEVARANKESGSSGGSIAYDEGRITGLKDALEVIYEIDPRT